MTVSHKSFTYLWNSPKPRCSLSVDLDPLEAYCQIHGLPFFGPNLAGRVVERGWSRFLQIAKDLHIPITFFVVGKTLRGRAQDLALESTQKGHELANHTQGHPYSFLTLSSEEMKNEIRQGGDTLEKLTGIRPVGFRSPGYGATPQHTKILTSLNYHYDSSCLPSPSYYLAKATVMGMMKVLGRPSGAHLHPLRWVLTPTQPYRISPSNPWKPCSKKQGPPTLWEIPITVAPLIRVPIIGTSVALAPPPFSWFLRQAARNQPLVNFECHAIDLLDAKQDGIPPSLVDKQPDLRIPLATKRKRLTAFLTTLKRTHKFTPLEKLTTPIPHRG